MNIRSLLLLGAALVTGLGLPSVASAQPGAESAPRWAVVMRSEKAGSLVKTNPADLSFTVLGDKTVLIGGESLVKKLGSGSESPVALRPGEEALLYSTREHAWRQGKFPAGTRPILKIQGMWVLLADETARMGLNARTSPFTQIAPLPVNTVVLTPTRPSGRQAEDVVSTMLERLDTEAWFNDVKTLADLKTRYTYSQGAKSAIDYCEKVFQELGLQTKRQNFGSQSNPAQNLEAIAPGFDAQNSGEVIVLGHLDSTSPKASTLAPGADDNGSGAAGVLALARFMKGLKGRATVRFVVVNGEEQGLLGSKAYVNALTPKELASLRGVLTMDMIAFDAQPPVSAVIETASFNTAMAEQLSDLAASYTTLTSQISYNPWGSDHVPFLKKEIPTVLTIESEYDSNPTYHQVTDTPEKMNRELASQILRLNAAALANLADLVRSPAFPRTSSRR